MISEKRRWGKKKKPEQVRKHTMKQAAGYHFFFYSKILHPQENIIGNHLC